MPNVNMPSDALLDAGDLASVPGPAVSTRGVVTAGLTLNHSRATCQTAPLTASIDLVVCIGRSTEAMPACKAIALNRSQTCAWTRYQPASSQAFSVHPSDPTP
jgi:hypothetical protein